MADKQLYSYATYSQKYPECCCGNRSGNLVAEGIWTFGQLTEPYCLVSRVLTGLHNWGKVQNIPMRCHVKISMG